MKKQKGFTVVEALIVIQAAIVLTVVGGFIYAAFHFINKFW